MSINKVVKKAAKVVGTVPIQVTPEIAHTQLIVSVRQLLLIAGGGLVANGTFTDDQWQQIVGALIAIGTFLYGQWRTRKDKAEKIIMATECTDNVACIKKP
jgi:hypothetical protein